MAKIEEQKISFETDDGEVVSFVVLEQTTLAGQNYLLVTDAEPLEEEQAYIMREVVASSEEGLVTYEFVEDDQELDSISKVFEELLEDTDIVK